MMKKLFILAILALVTTPAFAQSVDTAWVRRYNGPGNGDDAANAIAVDDSGNLYVTGYSGGSGTYSDYATIKYKPNGDTAWVRSYNGAANFGDCATAIAIDNYGNVYVTGKSTSTGGDYDYATIKYYSNGDTAWVRTYNGSINYNDETTDIAVDLLGNVYVTGWSWESGVGSSFTTIKYYANGDTAWMRIYSIGQAKAIAVDTSGNVYVTGTTFGSATNQDYTTIKYYPNGDTAWTRRYDGPANDSDFVSAIAVDSYGYVYVTGTSSGSGTSWDCTTIKYKPTGDTAWVRRYNGPANDKDWTYAIALDGLNNVYVTGYSDSTGSYQDYTTIKYDSSGNELWVKRYNGPIGNGSDIAYAIAVDGSNNAYVTGLSAGKATSLDYATIKYSSTGDSVWAKRYNGPANSADYASAITVNDSGDVYVTGLSAQNSTYPYNYDYATIKYVQFLCGDVNKDGVVSSADVVYLINYLFISGPAPVPILHVGDVNQDEVVNSADVVYLINYLFIGGPAPCS
jgi:hypothetical protein